jgi:hypothetical protein
MTTLFVIIGAIGLASLVGVLVLGHLEDRTPRVRRPAVAPANHGRGPSPGIETDLALLEAWAKIGEAEQFVEDARAKMAEQEIVIGQLLAVLRDYGAPTDRVIVYLSAHGPLTIAELARYCSWPTAHVTERVAALTAAGEVTVDGDQIVLRQ